MINFSNYDNANAKTTNYGLETRKDEINNYLKEIKKVRDVNFEDVCMVAELICKNIVSTAIEASDMTVDGIRCNLAEFTENIDVSCLDKGFLISCTIEYTPNSDYVLSVPYKTQMKIAVQNSKDMNCTFGCSSFEITVDNQKRLYNTDTLYSQYYEKPETFDLKLFCKL